MLEMYEGLSAVCAVLRELEPCAAKAPALRLAERHLRLLARLAAGHLAGHSEDQGASGPGCLVAPGEAAHVVQ